MSANKGLVLHSLLTIMARFIGVGLNLGLQILIARLLTLGDNNNIGHYGDLKMLVILVIGGALLSRLGVEQLMVKEIASVNNNQQVFGTQFLKKSYTIVFFSSVTFVLLWIIASPIIGKSLFGEITTTNLIIASIGVLFFNLLTVNAFYLKALRKASLSTLVQNTLPAITFLLLILVFWKSFPHHQFYLNIYTASTVLAGLMSIWIILPYTQTKKATQKSKVVETPEIKTIFV